MGSRAVPAIGRFSNLPDVVVAGKQIFATPYVNASMGVRRQTDHHCYRRPHLRTDDPSRNWTWCTANSQGSSAGSYNGV